MKFFLVLSLLAPSLSYGLTCSYKVKEETAKITWTGFKYTAKTPVSGTFKEVSFKQKESTSVQKLLESISFTIKTDSVDTGNPARDATLTKSIFGFLKVPQTIEGQFVSARENEVKTQITINEPMELKLKLSSEDQKMTLSGSLDLLENGLKKSYDSLHKACEGLHQGDDGVSKTWSTVDLKIEANYEEKCSKTFMDSIKDWFS